MKMKIDFYGAILLSLVLPFAAVTAWGGPAWKGGQLKDWTRRGHQIASARVDHDLLKVACSGTDGHLYSSSFDLAAAPNQYLVFRARGPKGGRGEVFWMAPGKGPTQQQSCSFEWRDDTDWHMYAVHLPWSKEDRIGQIRLDFPAAAANAGTYEIEQVAIQDGEPEIPAELRVGEPQKLLAHLQPMVHFEVALRVENLGTLPAKQVTIEPAAPAGGLLFEDVASKTVWGGEGEVFRVSVLADGVGTFPATFTVRYNGEKVKTVSLPLQIVARPKLARATYVPEPKPVETDYDIAALYYPGWSRAQAWERIWKVCPERRPVLGWYDEANPECVDWQIKWLVENGIRTLYVDWYWDRGSMHNQHWIEAFRHAKYRRHLKWAMMWANHNSPKSHSEADQREVTQFWIENYFNMPEYLQIDGKPVVWIWSPKNMQNDVPNGGCRKLLEISREMAKAAGYKGIHFISMKWPEADCTPATIQSYKDMGFDETGIYHFMDNGGPRGSRFSYASVAAANPANWWDQEKANVLPFLPNLSTGWDDRPWNNHCEIYGKNADDFRKICVEAKRFADATGHKRLCLSPLNEWGEGSYAEPNGEHGFAFYEAVRDTFCKKPASGWPCNFMPEEVGLGPYDLPPPPQLERTTSWTLTDGRKHGWDVLMGMKDAHLTATPDGLVGTTMTRDPAFACRFAPFLAKDFKQVVVRMKVEPSKPGADTGDAQLFWAGPGRSPTERASARCKLIADGAFHDYVFPVGENADWSARIDQFRLDPCEAPGVKITLARIACF